MALSVTGVFVYYYVRYSRLIDARLSGEVFNNASLILAAPGEVRVGQATTPEAIAARLRKALYAEAKDTSEAGTYQLATDRVEIYPGPASFFRGQMRRQGAVSVNFRNGHIASITALDGPRSLDRYLLEPEVITTLFDRSRTKRRLVRYQDPSKPLINAILATEDHRFFSHYGVNIFRLVAAVVTGLRADERIRGTSTLTMQLARDFFLTRERTLRRKATEIWLALLLEQRLTKEEIFELYVNQVYLGQRGSFAIHGVGEAASAYFGKDVSGLTLPEAALLAGIIHGPNRDSPYKYPERALQRRNFVLRRMLEVGFITPDEAERASAAPLGVIQQNVEGIQAPFFVDMVRDQLLAQFPERDLLSQSYRVYTALDMDLQRAASEAVRLGMAEVDQQIAKRRGSKKTPPEPNQPQVALVALDPRTGGLKALVGGRDYGVSQLNHVLARRQPGSSFKPFVYAAALSSGVDGSQPLITPATLLLDEPTTFQFGDQPYEPENYKQEYHGLVTLRQALAHSLNVATVRLAEMVGYDKVRNVGVASGINRDLLATPAIALGAYVATPLEIAAAYTVFANEGQYVAPRFILAVHDSAGRMLWRSPADTRQVLDPRVSYLMVSLLQSVINEGTGGGVRRRGLSAPAAGKTGTSHDGWFVGFTSNLLCAVWVGYDDDRELHLSGAYAALPVWTEFMKRAVETPPYGDTEAFAAPPGIVAAPVDLRTVGYSGTATMRNELFIEGTVPSPTDQREGGVSRILGSLFRSGGAETPSAPSAGAPPLPASAASADGSDTAATSEGSSDTAQPKKRGFVKRFLSVFKGGDSKPEAKTPPAKDNRP